MERSRVSFLISHHLIPVRLRLYTFRQIYQQFINISYLKAICIVSSAINSLVSGVFGNLSPMERLLQLGINQPM